MGYVKVNMVGPGQGIYGGNINVTPGSGAVVTLRAVPITNPQDPDRIYTFDNWSGLIKEAPELTSGIAPLTLIVDGIGTIDYQTPVTDPEISFFYPYLGSPWDNDPGLDITGYFSSTAADPHDVEVVLSSVPSTIDVTLTGGGTYSPGSTEWPYEITISAPTDVISTDDQNYTFSHWDGQFWQNNQDLFFDNTFSVQTFTIPNFYTPSMLRMRANYELVDYADTETEFEYQLTIRELDIANINIDDVTTEQYAIIEERFGGLVRGQNNIDFEFRELLPYVENEPVNLSVELNQGYQFVEWYGGDSSFISNFDGESNPITFNMLDVDTSFDLRVNAGGPFYLTTNYTIIDSDTGETPSDNNSVIGGGSLSPGEKDVEAIVSYGYEFVEWAGDVEFIVEGSIDVPEIKVNLLTNINLEAVLRQTLALEAFVYNQSVGPYTDNYASSAPLRLVFEPKQGRDLTVLNPEFSMNNGKTTIVEERDGRFPLGTYTLNNRDFWENITFDRTTQDSQINPKNFDGEVRTAFGRLMDTPDGPTVSTKHDNYFSVETLPYVRNLTTREVVPVNEYYDKKLESDKYESATEGKVKLKFGLRSSGRTSEGNINLFGNRWENNEVLKQFALYWPDEPGSGLYLTSLDWGDGSEKEFTSKPKLVEELSLFEHTYEKPGFYSISGVIFVWNNKHKYVAWWEKFESNLLLNPSNNYENGMYSFNNFAMIGGISENSSFAKTFYNLAGYDPINKELRESSVIDYFNEIDKIHMLDTLSKFDSQKILDDHGNIITAYSGSIVNENDDIIHNGFIDKRFFDSFKNTSLVDIDIASTKMYKGVRSMWKHLRFENDDSDNPGNDFYWKNIVPKDNTFQDLNSISVRDNPDPTKGSKVPRTPYKEIIINEDVTQKWDDGYYPVLPKIDIFGSFEKDVNVETSYGSASLAPITNVNEDNEKLIMNIDFNQTVTDDLIDLTGIFDMQYNNDYEVKLDDNLRIEKSSMDYPDVISRDSREQVF